MQRGRRPVTARRGTWGTRLAGLALAPLLLAGAHATELTLGGAAQAPADPESAARSVRPGRASTLPPKPRPVSPKPKPKPVDPSGVAPDSWEVAMTFARNSVVRMPGQTMTFPDGSWVGMIYDGSENNVRLHGRRSGNVITYTWDEGNERGDGQLSVENANRLSGIMNLPTAREGKNTVSLALTRFAPKSDPLAGVWEREQGSTKGLRADIFVWDTNAWTIVVQFGEDFSAFGGKREGNTIKGWWENTRQNQRGTHVTTVESPTRVVIDAKGGGATYKIVLTRAARAAASKPAPPRRSPAPRPRRR